MKSTIQAKMKMAGIEGDCAKAQAGEEPQIKTLRGSVLRESAYLRIVLVSGNKRDT